MKIILPPISSFLASNVFLNTQTDIGKKGIGLYKKIDY